MINNIINFKKTFKFISLVFIGVILFLLFFEFIIYFTDLDTKSLKSILYHHDGDSSVYVPIDDANRIFGLKPNSFVTSQESVHPKENKYKIKTIAINSLGFRDKERSVKKTNGIYRIIILGESNTFGPSVNNEDTYPAILEKLLNNKYLNKFEIWNAGISTYTMSQKIAYAEEILQKYDPDLLIFQDNNRERRAFLYGYDYFKYFKKNKELYRENIPLLIFPQKKSLYTQNNILNSEEKIHYYLIDHSRVYRFLMIILNNIFANKHFKLQNNLQFDKADELYAQFYFYGIMRDYRDFKSFVINHPDKKIVLLDTSIGSGSASYILNDQKKYINLDYIALNNYGKTEEYKYCHPPSYVYEWYADELMKMLEQKDYINDFFK